MVEASRCLNYNRRMKLRNAAACSLALLAFACSGTNAGNKDAAARAEAAGADVATATGCSTFSSDTVVSSMSAADQQTACHEFAACDIRPYQADPAGMYCDLVGMLSVALGDAGFASDTDVQAACKAKKATCLDDPSSADKGNQALQASLDRGCPSTVTCPWTMGQVESCWKALRASTTSPTCDTMTVAMTRPRTADAATLALPAECPPLADGTCLQIAVGVTSK